MALARPRKVKLLVKPIIQSTSSNPHNAAATGFHVSRAMAVHANTLHGHLNETFETD